MSTVSPRPLDGNSPSETTFIYALVDPNTEQIRYVGKANDPAHRLKQHLKEKLLTYKRRWLQSLAQQGQVPVVRVLEEVSVACWQEREQWWIAEMRRLGCSLVNGTDGGDGVHGMRHTEEARAKIGAASKGNKYGLGYKPTPEQKARQRAAMLGHAVRPDTGQKISAAKRGRPCQPEVRAKIAIALTGRKYSEVEKAAHRGKKLSEEHKARISAAQKGRPKSEESKAKMRGRRHSEEAKARMSAAQKAVRRVYTDELLATMRERSVAAGCRPPSRKGMTVSAETRAKISATSRARKADQDAAHNNPHSSLRWTQPELPFPS